MTGSAPHAAVLSAYAPDALAMGRLGAAVAEVLGPGDTILLGGDLGAGKTTFTKGLAAALGARGPVTSPTFVLVHSYPTARGWDLLHADVWRLEQLQEVVDLAIPELLEDGAAAVVEWGERAAPALGTDRLHVEIDFEDRLLPDPGRAEVATSVYSEATPDAQLGSGTDAGPGAEGVRRVTFSAHGPEWEARMVDLARALEMAQMPAPGTRMPAPERGTR
ncbi:MAG TPA: tRNA (adenosine(37)-N6)-threonylcarbamoyltransferase complex ATPase subunit type 1 TsaE [Acidimicrobiales bacterium]|nr:tRNA (adenosine(37)-N6)-threonylcarbamoyltransferase complex ATPase subunit type 1 TsaE [Acidimicrobiales bacterium]